MQKPWKPIVKSGNKRYGRVAFFVLLSFFFFPWNPLKGQENLQNQKKGLTSAKEGKSSLSKTYPEEEDFSTERELKPQFYTSQDRYMQVEAPRSTEWFSLFEIQLTGYLAKQRSSLTYTQSQQKWTEKDLFLDREEPFVGGELRLGTSIIHLRFFYLEGKYKGKGRAEENLTLSHHTINVGNPFESRLFFRYFFADLNVSAHYQGPYFFSSTLRFSAGLGFFKITEETWDGTGRGRESEDALTLHYGMEGMVSLGKWLTFLAGLRGAAYKDKENHIARMSNLALFAAAKVYFGSYCYVQLKYEFQYFRLNKKGIIYYLMLYGPSISLVFRF